MGHQFKAAVGASVLEGSSAAGAEAVKAALATLGGLTPRLALLFCTSRHDPVALLAAVRAALPAGCVVAGGFAVGTITNDGLGYDGHQVGVAVVAGDELPGGPAVALAVEEGLAGREHEVGAALGQKLRAAGMTDGDALLLFYDTVKNVNGVAALNLATPLLAGLSATCSIPAALAGMGTLGDMQLHPTAQFANDRVLHQSALGLVLKAPLRLDAVVLHGCRPAGRYYEVTNTDGQTVLELDHRPALEVIGEMLGAEAGLSWEDYAFFVTLGVNRAADPYAPFVEENYANRMCIGIDRDRKGLVMFENDLRPGTRVQLMRRAIDTAYIPDRVARLMAGAEGRKPLLCFYIDCAGRAAAYSGMDEEEADTVRAHLPKDVPLLGVYSGVEIARIGGLPQALDWTGVLCLLTVDA